MVSEGDSVKFICNIENYDSTTEVTWYCGVRQLEAGEKYEIEYEDGVAVITINKIVRADDGTYRCKVVNEYGEDSAYAELFVSGVRSYRDFFTTRVIRRTKRRVDTARMLQKPPEFTLPLVNRTAYLGEDIRFGVTITVHPEPRVIWHKSGQKLIPGHDDRKYTFISDKGLYQLIIHNLEKEDDAEYSVVARNRYGDDSCKARLTVVPRPKPADLTLRPMFKRLLANIECKEGQNIRFEIRVSAKPEPEIKWFHNGKEIHQSSKYFMTNISGVLTLQINNCVTEDSGTYRVICKNAKGETSDYATLDVAGEEYAAFSSFRKEEEPPTAHLPEMTRTEVYHVSSSKTTVEESVTGIVKETSAVIEEPREKPGVPATILTKPKSLTDVSAEPGKSLTVAGLFSGDPAPSVQWLRSGRTLPNGDQRFHVDNAADLSTLMISAVKEADAGAYTLRLSNELGSDSATVNVHVRSM
uniref:Ig-like domain-containing protein n=1 Tax=Cyprinodon variegatus TaxID=28743 RepID=A0A3Q2DHI9_CYPVA